MIIFDLDDTLIDTSGSVTPFKLRSALGKLIEEGLEVADFEQAYQRLVAFNEESPGSGEAFARFLQRDPKLLAKAKLEMISPLPPHFQIKTTPGAKEILQELSQNHILALVTGGTPAFQLEKLEKAGIDKSYFSKIAIPEDSVKKPFYEGLIREFSIPASEVLVCGDRVAVDLAPAHELGCKTVHMRWGRGKKLSGEAWVTHSISQLSELKIRCL